MLLSLHKWPWLDPDGRIAGHFVDLKARLDSSVGLTPITAHGEALGADATLPPDILATPVAVPLLHGSVRMAYVYLDDQLHLPQPGSPRSRVPLACIAPV